MPRPDRTDDYPRIYTAGAMRWEDSDDSHWRRSVAVQLEDITFFHPEDGYFDHGGDFVSGAVAEDIHAINTADGVVAYISETPQIGTVVEVLHAVHNETPVLVLLDEEYTHPGEDGSALSPVELRGEAADHWFLVNYLLGDHPSSAQRRVPHWIQSWKGYSHATVHETTEEDIRERVEEWIRETFGVPA